MLLLLLFFFFLLKLVQESVSFSDNSCGYCRLMTTSCQLFFAVATYPIHVCSLTSLCFWRFLQLIMTSSMHILVFQI